MNNQIVLKALLVTAALGSSATAFGSWSTAALITMCEPQGRRRQLASCTSQTAQSARGQTHGERRMLKVSMHRLAMAPALEHGFGEHPWASNTLGNRPQSESAMKMVGSSAFRSTLSSEA